MPTNRDHVRPVAEVPTERGRRREHLTACLQELFGDLTSRLAAADHQHGPSWKDLGIAIAVDVDLEKLDRDRRRGFRSMRALVRPRRDHDRSSDDVPR
jgi:hypothetical protein